MASLIAVRVYWKRIHEVGFPLKKHKKDLHCARVSKLLQTAIESHALTFRGDPLSVDAEISRIIKRLS